MEEAATAEGGWVEEMEAEAPAEALAAEKVQERGAALAADLAAEVAARGTGEGVKEEAAKVRAAGMGTEVAARARAVGRGTEEEARARVVGKGTEVAARGTEEDEEDLEVEVTAFDQEPEEGTVAEVLATGMEVAWVVALEAGATEGERAEAGRAGWAARKVGNLVARKAAQRVVQRVALRVGAVAMGTEEKAGAEAVGRGTEEEARARAVGKGTEVAARARAGTEGDEVGLGVEGAAFDQESEEGTVVEVLATGMEVAEVVASEAGTTEGATEGERAARKAETSEVRRKGSPTVMEQVLVSQTGRKAVQQRTVKSGAQKGAHWA
ncbi:hypothetical protein AB1Y20_009570 [Prymnesium parvum]|uniref:Uncharacterized protein n=1 Tax=Prymnesium parvum TaxID=97485 RepID=A0AB34K5H2_PRYPA